MCKAFGFTFKEIQNIGQVEERENLIIFHPNFIDNPDWVKVERLDELEHSENAVYIFGEDDGKVLKQIEEWSGDIKDKFRFVMIPMRTGYLSGQEFKKTGGGVARSLTTRSAACARRSSAGSRR